MAVSEAQKRARKRYEQKNKEKTAYMYAKNNAKSFIRNKAERKDIEEIMELCRSILDEKFS